MERQERRREGKRTVSLLVRMECECGESAVDLCNLWRSCPLAGTGDAVREKSVKNSKVLLEGRAKKSVWLL